MHLQTLISLVPFYLLWKPLLATGIPQPPPSDARTPVLDSTTDAFINKVIADWKSPGGIAVSYVRKNDQGEWVDVEARGYGVADANGTRMSENTMFNIGSNSKLFTVLANGILIHNETLSPRLDWDTKIKSVIPQFNFTDPIAAQESNLLDLMTHRTGYPLHDFAYRYSDSVEVVINKVQYLRQSAEFRDIWQYNNNMYTTLSHVPEVLTGRPFARYVKEHLLDPLNMTSTTYSYDLAQSRGLRADGMARQGIDVYADPFAGTPRAVQYWAAQTGGEDGNVLAGCGGVITSVTDMVPWLKMLLLNGVNPATNETVVPDGVLHKITTAISVQAGQPEFPEVSSVIYGAAQLQITYRGHLIVEHGGFIRGFNTQVTRLPNSDIGVAVFTNDHEYGKVMGEIVKNHILDKVLELDPIDWNSRYKAIKSVPPVRATPRPANVTLPSLNFTALAGTYQNPGYGKFDLCLVVPDSGAVATSACEDMASNLSTVLPNSTRPGIPTYFAKVDSPWFSHIRVEHFDANLFNVSLLISTPTNDPALPYWTFNDKSSSDNGMIAELNVEGSHIGIGMAGYWAGLWDGAAAGVPKPIGDTVRARAEVYWDKI